MAPRPAAASRRRLALAMLAVLWLAPGCSRRTATGPLTVSVIGHALDGGSASRDAPAEALLAATHAGLVGFDATGQVEPALAGRWIVIDDGTTYIFRLRDGATRGDRPITAQAVAAGLERATAPRSGNPLAPYLTSIGAVVAMTPQVVEIRLHWPRPNLIQLFAQPDLALFAGSGAPATGAFTVVRGVAPGVRLHPRPTGEADASDGPDAVPPDIALLGEDAAHAIARFASGRADLVDGGGFDDWPLLGSVDLPAEAVRTDPASGLFGVRIAGRDGFLADADNRSAVAAAIDPAATLASVDPDWAADPDIVPPGLESSAPAAAPAWTALPLADRRAAARERVAAWTAQHPGPLTLRIALPGGPGGTRIYGALAAALIAIGIVPQRVAGDAPADLVLVDAVAPSDSARWYLQTACGHCGQAAEDAIEAVRTASAAARAQAIGAAEAALIADAAFLPLGRPLRWSLIGPRADGWQPNARAVHPLNHLVAAPS